MARSFLTLALVVTVTTPVWAAETAAPSKEDLGPVNAFNLPTPAGRVRVYLPDDIRPGDTISGTVVALPRPGTVADRDRDTGTLSGYVIDVGGTKAKVGDRHFNFIVPAGLTSIPMRITDGRTRLNSYSIPLAPPSPAATTAPPEIVLPATAQAGNPLRINGPFDGDASNTKVTVGGAPAEVLAESPRQTVVRAPPPTATGVTTISVSEGGQTATGAFRNINITLTAPKTTLIRGETTTLTIKVSGLEGITQPVPMTVVGSATISLGGGNAQTVQIAPGGVGAGGLYQTMREIQARVAGDYEITARIAATAAPKRDSLYPDGLDMVGIDSAKELQGLIAGMTDSEQVALLQATLRALRARLANATDADTKRYLNDKIAIVGAALDSLGISH